MPDINKTADLVERLREPRYLTDVEHAQTRDSVLDVLKEFRRDRREAANAIEAQAAEISRLRDALAMIDLIMEEAAKDNSPYGRSDGMALGRIRQLLGLNPATGAARTALEANHG